VIKALKQEINDGIRPEKIPASVLIKITVTDLLTKLSVKYTVAKGHDTVGYAQTILHSYAIFTINSSAETNNCIAI